MATKAEIRAQEAADKKAAEEKAKEDKKIAEKAKAEKDAETTAKTGKIAYKNGRAHVRVTESELNEYQQAARLVGYDPATKIALIKEPEDE